VPIVLKSESLNLRGLFRPVMGLLYFIFTMVNRNSYMFWHSGAKTCRS